MDDLLGDIPGLPQGTVSLLLHIIGLAVARLRLLIHFLTHVGAHAAAVFHVVFLGHQMVIGHVAQVKIPGSLFQQQVDLQVSAHIHLPNMGEACQLVHTLIRQAPPGLEGYKAAATLILYGNVVCGIGGRECVSAQIGFDGKQGGAEAHQAGQDGASQEPGGIEPNQPPGNEGGN